MDIINNQELLTGVATNIVEDSIKGAWDRIKKFFKAEFKTEREQQDNDTYLRPEINISLICH